MYPTRLADQSIVFEGGEKRGGDIVVDISGADAPITTIPGKPRNALADPAIVEVAEQILPFWRHRCGAASGDGGKTGALEGAACQADDVVPTAGRNARHRRCQ